jgi:hypothetical protein
MKKSAGLRSNHGAGAWLAREKTKTRCCFCSRFETEYFWSRLKKCPTGTHA